MRNRDGERGERKNEEKRRRNRGWRKYKRSKE